MEPLTSLLSRYRTFITYRPLRTEVVLSDFMIFPEDARTFEIPARASIDPEALAREAIAFAGATETVLLIPGRRFDAAGTRHGQGGGWYDRFLAHVPRTWLRVGFCFDDQLSPTPLIRESWDQAMDYVGVVDRKTGMIAIYSAEGGQNHA
jgi:5-formyltetrahydrofolate cyclo-ligase